MKIIISSLLFLSLFFSASAQESNLIFFSEAGEEFQIFLNGVAQNSGFTTNVKVTGLNQPYYKARVIFRDRSMGEIDKNLQFNPNTETVFVIKLAKKGYVLRWQSEVPLAQAQPPMPEQEVIIYHSEPIPQTEANTSIQSTTTTSGVNMETNANAEAEPSGENTSISIDLPDVKMNVSMKVREGMGRFQSGSSTSTTSTSSYSSSSSSTDGMQQNAQPAETAPTRYNIPGYSGPYGCDWPASSSDFNSVKSSISSKTFRDDKLTVTKQIMRSKCFTTDQVKEMIGLFTYEDDKLEVAKMAYPKTFDQGNYYKINDAFTFSSTIDELNEFLESR